MDALYVLGEGSVAEVLAKMEDPPSYASVRVTLRIMEEKGYVSHRQQDAKYVYAPIQQTDSVGPSMLQNVVTTFFGGRAERAVAALIGNDDARLTDEQLAELERMIQEAKRR